VNDFTTQYEATTAHDAALTAPLKVLVAEDNAADRFWLEMVLKTAGISYTMIPVTDGEAARDYLLQHGDEDPDVPDLVFLDQSLPCLTAMEIVQQVPRLKSLPYCIVTGSTLEKDLWVEDFGLSPHCYVVKPLTRKNLAECLYAFSSLRHVAEAIERSAGT